MSNLDQIASDPSSFEEIVEATLSAIPGNERIVFGADLLAAIKTKAFELIGRQGRSSGVASKKRGSPKGQPLISRENILKKLPNINRPEG